MDILDVFRARGQQLFWRRFDDNRISGRPSGEPIESEQAYAVVRLAEMYLGRTRTMWRKYSPLVHAFVTSGEGKEQHSVAGPGQLQDLSEKNLDRVIVLNHRLAGPIPYRGEELTVLAGLYSVPREDTAAALVGTVGALAGLGGPAAVAGAEVANVVKTGVDSILGLGDTVLRLGVKDTFSAGNPLRSGFLVGIGAPQAGVDRGRLWIKDGQLRQGNSLVLADAYTDDDYFIVQIERLERRHDWPGVPGMAEYEARFRTILSSGKDRAGLFDELKGVWPQFREALVSSPHLTRHDAEEIANDVEVDLVKRVDAVTRNIFVETRSWGSDRTERLEPRDVDFAAVPERTAEDEAAGTAAFAAQAP